MAMPMAQANPPTPGTRKKGLIKGSRSTPKNLTTPNPINNSDMTKNGKSDGKTISHHIFNPRMDAFNDSSGIAIMDMAIKETDVANSNVFIFDKVNLLNTVYPLSNIHIINILIKTAFRP
ncbi:hypothetical protein J14TS2_48660 [Bacillus sp. J14TS2]|nr:hypothetical protein J14TS2_48660 [Bacillus sp. J14TS2]